MTTPTSSTPTERPNTISAGFGNREMLRDFIKERYGDNPPRLTWVAGIPSEEGGGVRYTYSDGSIVEGHGSGWLWYARSDLARKTGEWDPIRG